MPVPLPVQRGGVTGEEGVKLQGHQEQGRQYPAVKFFLKVKGLGQGHPEGRGHSPGYGWMRIGKSKRSIDLSISKDQRGVATGLGHAACQGHRPGWDPRHDSLELSLLDACKD